MEWNDEMLSALALIFRDKSHEIHGQLCPRPRGHLGNVKMEVIMYEKAWVNYLLGLGLKMELAVNSERFDSECLRHVAFVSNGARKVRIVNAWGDRYIDMSEEFAFKTLVLGFLP